MFSVGDVSTKALSRLAYHPRAIEVLVAGTFTTIQDYPGRVGHWDVEVQPSGPMDDYAFRIAGNDAAAAGIECTLAGPTLKFHADVVVALTGAPADALVDGTPVALWSPLRRSPLRLTRTATVAACMTIS